MSDFKYTCNLYTINDVEVEADSPEEAEKKAYGLLSEQFEIEILEEEYIGDPITGNKPGDDPNYRDYKG